MTHNNPAKVTGLLLAAATVVSGCGYQGAQSLPLPGAIGGPDTYRVTVTFSDATNLVPKETCRSNDTVIGSVESVSLDDNLNARVVCTIRNSVRLPGNTVGALRDTSLLGERYVELGPPENQPPVGELRPGSSIPRDDTRADPNTEQVLGALSAVLNGGNLGRIQDITRELNDTLDGRGGTIRGLLDKLTTLTTSLNEHRGDITTALDSMDGLTGTLARQRTVLGSALDTIPSGLRVLSDQRPKLTATLRQLSTLSETAVPLIAETKEDTVANLRHLAPVLGQLSKNGDEIASSLEIATDFPFPSNAQSVIKGDYGGMFGTININADTINHLLEQEIASLTRSRGGPTPNTPGTATPGKATPRSPLPAPLGDVPGAGGRVVGGVLNTTPLRDLGQLLTGGNP